jgi:hypothetical protein
LLDSIVVVLQNASSMLLWHRPWPALDNDLVPLGRALVAPPQTYERLLSRQDGVQKSVQAADVLSHVGGMTQDGCDCLGRDYVVIS